MERTLVSDAGAGGGLGTQTRVDHRGTATVIEAFAPYEPTVQWQLEREPTMAWTVPPPSRAPQPWHVALGSAGLVVAVTLGFCLGRTVPVAAADRSSAPAQLPAAGTMSSVPVVLPDAPDLSRSYPVAPAASSRPASWNSPAWSMPPAGPVVTVRPVARRTTPVAFGAARMSAAPMSTPPPVQLYGTPRVLRNAHVSIWVFPRGG